MRSAVEARETAGDTLHEIELRLFDCPVRIATDDGSIISLISACYSAFMHSIQVADAVPVELEVLRGAAGREWSVRHGDETEICRSVSDLVYFIEKMMTIELQRRRPDLFFLHAAAVSVSGRSVMIIGESGAGKSTLCWDLCNAGFSYMSDELAPINLGTMQVEPYPHALCLKQIARHMPGLPDATIRTESTFHIPVEAVPGGVERDAVDIGVVVFLQRGGEKSPPNLTEMPRSESAARFYANGLNQLAHQSDGLKAAAKLAAAGKCYSLARGTLSQMRSELIRGL